MTPQQVVEHYGSRKEMAKALGASRQAVDAWINGDREFGLGWQFQVEDITGGKLRADRPWRDE